MFGNSDSYEKNRIIDGEFTIDRYVTVLIDGQVHSRKVKQNKDGEYIEIDNKIYMMKDFN